MMKKIICCAAILVSQNSFASNYNYGAYKVGDAYVADGQTFYPKQPDTLIEKGMASWYGSEFQNKQTANGAIFDKNFRSAAHRTLPLPSAILVRNLENGNQTIAIVNDRGPFSKTHERILDVSEKAAKDLDIINKGHAMVEIEYLPILSSQLKKNPNIDLEAYIEKYEITKSNVLSPVTDAVPEKTIIINQNPIPVDEKTPSKTTFIKGYAKDYYVQIGVFENLQNAQKLYEKVVNDVPKVQIRSENSNAKMLYVIRSGPFETESEAKEIVIKVPSYCKDCNSMVVVI